jgi:hypothetical protein
VNRKRNELRMRSWDRAFREDFVSFHTAGKGCKGPVTPQA